MSEQINVDEDLCVFFAEKEHFLFGFISDNDETMLVTELAPLGALDIYLRNKKVGAMYFIEISFRILVKGFSVLFHCKGIFTLLVVKYVLLTFAFAFRMFLEQKRC